MRGDFERSCRLIGTGNGSRKKKLLKGNWNSKTDQLQRGERWLGGRGKRNPGEMGPVAAPRDKQEKGEEKAWWNRRNHAKQKEAGKENGKKPPKRLRRRVLTLKSSTLEGRNRKGKKRNGKTVAKRYLKRSSEKGTLLSEKRERMQ